MLARNQNYLLKEIIDTYIQAIRKANNNPLHLHGNFFLYGREKELHIEESYFLGEYPDVDEDKWVDIYPPPVQAQGLDAICSGDILIEVISSVLRKNPTACDEEYVNALNDYLRHNTFSGSS